MRHIAFLFGLVGKGSTIIHFEDHALVAGKTKQAGRLTRQADKADRQGSQACLLYFVPVTSACSSTGTIMKMRHTACLVWSC